MKRRKKRRRPPLNDLHFRAIDLLSEKRAHNGKIADKLGITRMTLYRWRQREDFRRELEDATRRKAAVYVRDMERYMATRNVAVFDVKYIESVIRINFGL